MEKEKIDMRNKVTKNYLNHLKKGGFTLIELLVVIVILGILATIGLRSFQSTQLKSRDARRKEDLSSVARALEAYYNDKGSYPEGSAVTGQIVGCRGADPDTPVACDWGGIFQDYRGTFYMTQLPDDPSRFSYFYISDGISYQLFARLENTQDQSIARDGDENPAGYNSTICGTGILCNYVIVSSNSLLPTGVTVD